MAAIEDLISKIQDESLRKQIAEEVNKLKKTKKFGLIYENHLPERAVLFDMPIKIGSKVTLRRDKKKIYQVAEINGETATCFEGEEQKIFPLSELLYVAEIGEPIYPYLKQLDSIKNAPTSDLWHTLIEAENYHALQLLDYMYHGKVDCIYIDPPYNTGAKDWKYNNDYVDGSDQYRHSKWLSMMEKRLKLAKKLLNDSGAIFISIDDGEACSLKLLCDEVIGKEKFVAQIPWRKRTSKSDVPFGISQDYESILCYANENFIGKVQGKGRKYYETDDFPNKPWRFHDLTKQTTAMERPNSFFTIMNPKNGKEYPANPLRTWAITKETFKEYYEQNRIIFPGDYDFLKISKPVLRYWQEDDMKKAGEAFGMVAASTFLPADVGMTQDGTKELAQIFNDKRFPFPKPLNLIKHLLTIATSNKKDALILDFFAGSGTTLHAVNLLNAEDGGNRRCILVTNNEVSLEEAKNFEENGIQEGSDEWNAHGIARYVTWPRTRCSILGENIKGEALKGNYLGSDRPMSDGFSANAIFFKLGFLDKMSVALGKQLQELISILWLKAGAIGECPPAEANEKYMIYSENNFAVLVDPVYVNEFKEKLSPNIEVVYIITDYEKEFNDISTFLSVKKSYQLYKDYLENFKINTR